MTKHETQRSGPLTTWGKEGKEGGGKKNLYSKKEEGEKKI